MALNEAGMMIERAWEEIPMYYPAVDIDAFIVMPNHMHGIIVLQGAPSPAVGPPQGSIEPTGDGSIGPTRGATPTLSLSEIVRRFKTLTTRRYIHGVVERGWPRFNGQVWQRSYYEHVVRDETDLQRIREYIENNPIAWSTDPENPSMTA